MPYDSAKVRSLIAAAEAHSMHPGGEIMTKIAEQLKYAEKEMLGHNTALTSAVQDSNNYKQQLDTERAEVRVLHARTQVLETLVDPMRSIASGAKGPKKIAEAALAAAEIPLVAPTEVAQPVETAAE